MTTNLSPDERHVLAAIRRLHDEGMPPTLTAIAAAVDLEALHSKRWIDFDPALGVIEVTVPDEAGAR